MSEKDNLSAWRSATETLFDIDLSVKAEGEAFVAELRSFALGAALFGYTRSCSQRFIRSRATIARSGVDHILVQYYRSGGFTGLAGDQPIQMNPGDICVLDLAETINTVATPFEAFTLVLPRAMLELRMPNLSRVHGVVLAGDSALGLIVGRHFSALFDVAPQLTVHECEQVVSGTVALVAACLKGELDQRPERDARSLAPIARIKRYIDEHLTTPDLDVDTIADRLGLSRATLYRLFEPFNGVAGYIRRRRLHQAFFELTGGGPQRIGVLARKYQFANESSFSRAFKAAYGCTPTAACEASLLARTPTASNDDNQQTMLSRWMRGIAAGRLG